MHWVWLGLLGIVIGAMGTLIGAGGGFVLMPILVLLYPDEKPETLASISLAVVFLNALSGSYGYARQGLVDFKAGKLFMAAGIPGAVAGSFVTATLPRTVFDVCLGSTLVVIAGFILITGALRPKQDQPVVERGRGFVIKGVVIAFVVGFVSTLLGIGGGIIHVPAMVYVLHFPVHAAAATSHFVLAGTALAGTLTHVATGAFVHGEGWRRTIALGIGAMIGAQGGALFAKRTPPGWILRGLGVALAVVGVRVVWIALGR